MAHQPIVLGPVERLPVAGAAPPVLEERPTLQSRPADLAVASACYGMTPEDATEAWTRAFREAGGLARLTG